VWISEQREAVVGSYVDNVYLVGETVVLRLRCRDGSYRELVLEPSKRISFTKRKIRPQQPTQAQTLWRSLLRNCRVSEIRQLGEERVVFVELSCGASQQRTLVAEILPRGVVAVISNEKIVASTATRVMKDRAITRGSKYTPPPARPPLSEIPVEKLLELLATGKDVVRGLIRGWGVPPEVAETVLHEMGMDPRTPPESIDAGTADQLRKRVLDLVDRILRSPEPCIVYRGGELEGFYPFVPPTRADGAEVRRFDSFDEAVDEYFAALATRSAEAPPEIAREIERLRRAAARIEESIERRRARLEQLRKLLEAVESRYLELERGHEAVRKVVRSRGWEALERVAAREGSPITRIDPKRGVYVLRLGDAAELELDVRKSFIEIYSELRREVSELERDIERSRRELERIKSEISRLENEAREYVESRIARLARKVEWFERFHWTVTSSGFLVLGGRDASQNISLLRRYAEPHDIVMHADVRGASAVVIKTGGRDVPESDLREAATLAACYSKAWKAGRRCVDVFWVKREQVSLSAPPGEYLPKGSFMVYGRKNYIRCVELQLGVGVELVDREFYRVFVGPEHLVAKRCVAYAVLEPGSRDPSSVAKEIVERMSRAGLGVVAKSVDLSELSLRIPGRSRIVKFVAREVDEVRNRAEG